MKTTRTRLISIFLATMMVLSMSSLMFAVSATAIDNPADAKTAIEGALATYTATNETTKVGLLADMQAVIDDDETSELTLAWSAEEGEAFAKVDATEEEAGSITGVIVVDLDTDNSGANPVTVEVELTIAKLTGGGSGDLALAIDYVAETLTITNGTNDAVAYVYAMKYPVGDSPAESKLKSVKWYPMYGNVLDISLLIPKKYTADANKAYIIAVKAADGTGDLMKITIDGRPDTKDVKKAVAYDFAAEKLKNTDATNSLNVYLNNSNRVLPLSAGADIAISYDLFPAGSSFTFKIPAVASASFASAVVKGKIAAQAKAPKVEYKTKTVEEATVYYLKGSKAGMEIVSVNGTPITAVALTGADAKDITVANLISALDSTPADGGFTVGIRVAATDRKGYSKTTVVEIKAEAYTGSGSEEPTPDPASQEDVTVTVPLATDTDTITLTIAGGGKFDATTATTANIATLFSLTVDPSGSVAVLTSATVALSDIDTVLTITLSTPSNAAAATSTLKLDKTLFTAEKIVEARNITVGVSKVGS